MGSIRIFPIIIFLLLFAYDITYAVSVFLKNGSIIDGTIIKRDRYGFVIRDNEDKDHRVFKKR